MNTDSLRTAAFENHPDPMWIYDLETLRFLEVNHAAVRKYGYTREEFLQRTIADIRPPEDIEALLTNVKAATSGPSQSGLWRHVLKEGRVIYVDINSHTLEYQGRRCQLVCVRDMSRLIELQLENDQLLDRERRACREAEAAAHHFQQLFETVPGKFLVLIPNSYEIVAVSDEYLEVTLTRRHEIKGRSLFEIFPEAAGTDPSGHGDGLRNSLDRVARYGSSDIMGIHSYPIRRPTSQGGGLEERFWSIVNTPIRGPDGSVAFIVHRVEDVTKVLRSGNLSESAVLRRIQNQDAQLELDILLRSRELQAANDALREHEANLRTAQRLLGLGLWKLDPETGNIEWPEITYAIYGVDSATFRPNLETYIGLVHPQDREQMLANYDAFAVSNRRTLEFAHRITTPAGEVRHIRGIGEETSGPNGKKFLTGIVLDVTQQKQAELATLESNLLLRTAGRAARLGAWRVTLEPLRVIWSAQTVEIHEEPPDTSPSLQRAIEYYAPEYRDRVLQHFNDCSTAGVPFDDLLELITARGNRLWVRCIGEPEYGDDGSVHAVRGAFQDVTELIAAQQKANRLADQLQETLENISDAFITIDRDWNIQFLNSRAKQMLNRGAAELVGRNIWQAFPEAAGSGFQSHYERAMHKSETAYFTEYYAPLKSWFEVKAYPTTEGLAIYFNDVTAQRELEERLRQSQKLEALGQLTGGIAHDFNNLLAVILGSAEALASRLTEQPAARELAEMVAEAAESGAELTNRLLTFARRQALQPLPTDVNQLISRMNGLLRRTLGEDIDIEIVHGDGLWTIEIDSGQMENVILNLAINARDAMPDGGRLAIETANASLDDAYALAHEEVSAGQYVMISITDTGTGMSPEVVARAFDPFFTTKELSKGTGLGLSIVYGFVKQSGGHAKIYSHPGEGTSIRLYFPRVMAVAEEARIPLDPSELPTGSEHILVVEDDSLVLKNLLSQLASLGYRVTAARDGPSALELLQRNPDVDLLFTDVVMPGGMNGRQLADIATERYPALKVLFTSGYSENAIAHGGRLDHGVHLLSKPYRMRDMAMKVRRVLEEGNP